MPPRDLSFPMGGLDRRLAYQTQRPYTTADAENVRPDGTLESRTRGGSRPGLSKVDGVHLGGEIDMLGQVQEVLSTPGSVVYWTDNFDTLNGVWKRHTFSPQIRLHTVHNGYAQHAGTDDGFSAWGQGAQRIITTMDMSAKQVYELRILPKRESTCELFMWIDDATGNFSDNSVYLRVYREPAQGAYVTFRWKLYNYRNGVQGNPASGGITELASAADGPFTMTAIMHLNDQIEFKWNGVRQFLSPTNWLAPYSNATDTRFGFRLVNNNADGLWTPLRADWFKVTYTSSLSTLDRNRVVAMANSQFYYENDEGVMTEASVSNGVLPTSQTFGEERLGKFYFPEKPNATPESSNHILVWNPNDTTVDTIVNVEGAYVNGVEPPDNPSLITVYRDRLVAIKDHVWYMSRVGDPVDWNAGNTAGDVTQAVSGAVSDAAKLPKPITACIPFSDDYVVFGCADSLWIMRGDPAAGGFIDNLSRDHGILSQGAWCRTPEGLLMFLGKDGLYSLVPGGTGYPLSVSHDKLPKSLSNVDVFLNNITMVYDALEKGVHIFVTPTDSSVSGEHFWYDSGLQSFWPATYALGHEPASAIYSHSSEAAKSVMMIGCRDGWLRFFDRGAGADDLTPFGSYVMYGPIRAGGGTTVDGVVVSLQAVMDDAAGDVAWSLHAGNTAQKALTATAQAEGTWSAGWNPTDHPQVRANAVFLKVAGTGSQWAIESVTIHTELAGMTQIGN